MTHIMIDLETMGTSAQAPIISIGACVFDPDKGILDEFYMNVSLKSCVKAGRAIDADTVMWWMTQSDSARGAFSRGGVDLQNAIRAFTRWVTHYDNVRMWGNGANFDNAIMSDIYRQLDIEQPWKFWNDRCYRTVKSMHPEVAMVRSGTHHNALDDAKTQAEHLIKIAQQKLDNQLN